MKKLYAIITFCLFCGYPLFSQTISSNAPLCGNANLTLELSATGGSTYAWTGPNGFTSTLQYPTIKNINWKNRGVYTVIIDGKTTLTTDVNIKDPVAFTVPKEITVCEGGTLDIEPKSSRLTDSTEVVDSFQFKFPFYNFTTSAGIVEKFSSSKVGVYQVIGSSNNNGCSSTQNVSVKLNPNPNCGIINIESLDNIKMCFGQEVAIPFTTKGNFKSGTKFSVFISGTNYPKNELLTITDKSPAIIKMIPNKYDGSIIIKIEADDDFKTTAIASKRNYSLYELSNNYITSTLSCDSAKLAANNFISINNVQWYSDNIAFNLGNTKEFVTKKSGIYTFKYQLKNPRYEADKTCLYESQPVKIELGKIEKPYVQDTSRSELCIGKSTTLYVYFPKNNITYRWKKDGSFISNATNSFLANLQEGEYQVEAKEGTCTVLSDTIKVKKPSNLNQIYYFGLNSLSPIQTNNQQVYTLCNNQRFNFESGQVPFAKRQLFKNGVLIYEAPNRYELSTYSLQGEGTYFIKAVYGTCESVSKPITVKYNKVLKGYIYNKATDLCEGAASTTYFASTNLGSSNNFKPLSGEIFKDGKKLQDWNIISQNQFQTTIQINQSGSYYAQGKILLNDGSECTVKTDSITLNFGKKVQEKSNYYDPILKAVSITTCKDTTNISANNSIGSSGREIAYKWTKDGITLTQDSSNTLQATQAGTYQLETTYKGGCTVVSSPYKVEFGKLQITSSFDPNNLTICGGETFNLYGLKLSENQYSDKNISSLYKDSKLFKENYPFSEGTLLSESGLYRLDVKNGNCIGSYDFTLKVDTIPTTITPTDSVTFCAGKTVDLKASTETGLSYIWERNGSVISQANQATLTASTDGLYKATLLRGACWGTTPSVKLKSLANIIPTATITGDQKIGLDQETKLSVNLTSHAPWTFKLSDGKEYTATKSPFEITVKPLTTTTYNLSEVSNICGTGTVSGTAKIEVIILSTEEERELSVEVFPMPSSEICNWKIETPQVTTASVELIDVTGSSQFSEISNTRSQTHQGSINLTNLKAGTYFLKLQAGEKNVTRKVIKL
jgi:hypothetical protein